MGILSFLIFIMHETNLIHIFSEFLNTESDCVTSAESIFNWVDYGIFSFVFLYVFTCGYLLFAQLIVSKNWPKYDELGVGN